MKTIGIKKIIKEKKEKGVVDFIKEILLEAGVDREEIDLLIQEAFRRWREEREKKSKI